MLTPFPNGLAEFLRRKSSKVGLRRTKKRSCRNHMDDILCCRKKNQSHDTNLELNVVQCPKCYSCFSNSLSYGLSCVHGFAHEEQ